MDYTYYINESGLYADLKDVETFKVKGVNKTKSEELNEMLGNDCEPVQGFDSTNVFSDDLQYVIFI